MIGGLTMTVYRVYDAHTGELQLEGSAQDLVEKGLYRSTANVRSCYRSNIENRREGRSCYVLWEIKQEAEVDGAEVCRCCGKKFEVSGGTKCYCPECTKLNTEAWSKSRSEISKDAWRAKKSQKAALKAANRPKISIGEAVRLATAAGLSYGMWEAKRRIEREKNRS